ncbi:nitrous oxide reductase accessory protein NosL [Natrarchaeobaculum aegyptiacum]|uniref:Nitrous oxide reductase accessory protein NosL n=1 Tax=Natrarchaeobaculum aegyptiacum TaxID=745377 RepID=A0A2Z2HYB1_9EURY|nr:nitrous oxide reductase accessory protein NosL [Natrarchaeobaculum aegyptiacum]ARS91325.1 nitrous oxide reductase accessory protein NosL [Natrarchaeobaculum aegyptiacum]
MTERSIRTVTGDGCGSRRAFLGAIAATGAVAIAGCASEDEPAPDPVTIPDEQVCDHCSMIIGQHPGPNGQTHYDDAEAVFDEDRPGMFCASTCTYAHTFEEEDQGNEPSVIYLTDYSSVDHAVNEGQGIVEISSHLEADSFARADDLHLVVDSEVEGAMGASMIGFSDADDAEAFQAEYGGDIYEHGDVSRDLVMSLM